MTVVPWNCSGAREFLLPRGFTAGIKKQCITHELIVMMM